ncbi:MAG: response regulator transcription factor [Gammaproteobacteria bacterium]|nr:response regulator transcription factor [Gammaproteobacteria bacterium]
MKILIVDDEALARQRLRSLIAELHSDNVVSEAEHGLAALEKVRHESPDVVLLDIRMPLMDGLEVAHHLSGLETPPAVIFTTAYQDHALDAFDTSAVDYLLKPVRKERLYQALQRARVLQRARIVELRAQDNIARPRTHLSAIVAGNIQLVAVNDIRYLKAEQKYVVAVWPGGELLLNESLKSLETEFQKEFIRIHRNALIALQYIEALKKDNEGNVTVLLRGIPAELQVSRRHISHVRKIIKPSKH